MAQFKVGRPLQEVRLRNWDAGRVSQLKLAISRLEDEVNRTLPASVQQSARRKVSDQVPFILDLRVEPGFRQVILNFTPPPGLGGGPRRQLLFYEIQHDDDLGFGSPTVIQTPQTNLLISGLGLGETRAFRARVVSTFQEASTWTDTIVSTTARGKIQQTTIPDTQVRLTNDVGQFQTLFTMDYQPVGGAVTLHSQLSLATPHFDVTKKNPDGTTSEVLRSGPASAQFKWQIGTLNESTLIFDFSNIGERCLLSARPGFSDEETTPAASQGKSGIKTPMAFGTFMTPFFRPISDRGIIKLRLQAAKIPGSEWQGPESTAALNISDPMFFIRQSQVIEVLEQF